MDMFNDKELDHWLRQSAGQGHEPPAPDGWDTPPEAVWEQLRTGLDQRKKRRRWFLALWATALTGLITVTWWLWPALGAGTTLTSHPDIRVAENGLAPAPERAIIPAQAAAVANPASCVKDTPAANTKTTAGLPETTLPEQQHTTAPTSLTAALSKTRAGSVAGKMAYVKPAPNPVTNRRAVSAPVEYTPGNTTKPVLPFVANSGPPVELGEAPAETSLQAIIPPIKAPEASTQPDLLPLSVNVLSVPGYVPDFPYWPNTPALIHPLQQPSGWYAGLATGVFFTTRALNHTRGKTTNGRESGAWTAQQGFSFGLALNRHWALETGLQRTSVRIQAERLLLFRYQVSGEQFNPQRFLYQNSATDTIETAFGAVDMRMDIGREPSRPIANQATVQIVLHTDEQVHYWRVPLALRWTPAAAGPWQWSLAAGLGLNFEAGYDLRLTAARANRPGVREVRANARGRANGLAPLVADAQFGAQLGYRLFPHCSLLLTPEFRYGLSSMYRQGPFRSMAVSGGVQMGMRWQF